MHAPAAHRSASFGSQVLQALPPVPQVDSDGTLHALPTQQPAQVSAQPAQLPALQVSPFWQATHPLPPLPHAPA